MDNDLITFLRDKTQLSRFSPDEVQALLDAIRAEGYDIKGKKADPMTPLEAYLRKEEAILEGDEPNGGGR